VLAEERVDMIATRPAPWTPTTVVLPLEGDRAMVTVDPGVRAAAADVAAGAPTAVAANLDMLHVVPAGARAYVTCGDDEARAFKGRPPTDLAGACALFVNRAEALALTGEPTVEQAAAALGELAESVVVSLAADGGLLATGGQILTASTERVEAPVDTTGAGDLLTAAYIWADLRGADPIDRLRWAVLYASLGVTTPTAVGGALNDDDLLAAGTARGLRPPPLVGVARS
jgi:ribokinase